MNSRLSRLLRGIRTRSLDAGSVGRRWDGAKSISNLNASMDAAGPLVRQRGAYYARNNAWVARGVNAFVGNAIGTGIKPQSRHPDAQVRAWLHDQWDAWTDRADVTGMTDFYGQQTVVGRSLMEAGEGFVRFVWSNEPPYLQLQLIAADQIDPALHRDLEDGRRIRAGIELDTFGRRLAFHALPSRSGDVMPGAWAHVRVPAQDMAHVMEVLEPGQIRGLSWLAPVLLRVHGVDVYEDAQLVRQKIAALFAGFLVDPNGDAAGFSGTQTGSILETGLEPGTLKTLPPGYDIRFSEPAEVGDGADFLKVQLRAIAAGLGVTYEQLTGDLTGVNYSSIRAGLIEFRRRVDTVRWNMLVPQLCRPTWERFIRSLVIAGKIPAGSFERTPAHWLGADWHPPGWDWVDPLKDIEAERQAVEAGFKARSQVINERGEDPERIDALRAADRERGRRLGLDAAAVAAPSPGTEGGDHAG